MAVTRRQTAGGGLRFVPRVYQRNVDIESQLVSPCIADIDRRHGVLHAASTLFEDRVHALPDIKDYEHISRHVSQERLRGQMEAQALEHDRLIKGALSAADFQRLQVLDGPFCRRLMPNVADAAMARAQSNHAAHLRLMEHRRLREVHDAWEAVKDDERRQRTRKLFRPLELTAIPEVPYHRSYRSPSLYDYL